MKNALSYIILALFLVQGLLFLNPPREDVLIGENRRISQFPKTIRFTQKGVKNFFSDLDSFFADRLVWRDQAIDIVARLNEALNNYSDSFKVFHGQDDWLFLGTYVSDAPGKLTGLTPPTNSNPSVEKFRRNLAHYSHLPRFFIVAPNKSSVYPEKLPGFIQTAPVRYSTALRPYLEQGGLIVYDPTDLLINSKDRGLLYYRTDTHWNSLGAAVATEGFLECYNRIRPDHNALKLPDHNFSPGPAYKGDLLKIANIRDGSISDRAGDNFILHWVENRPPLLMSDGSGSAPLAPEAEIAPPAKGKPFRVVNPQALVNQRVWLFRDSFSSAMAPYIHAIFAETIHLATADLGKDLDQGLEPPDLIIFEIAERYL